MTTPPTYYLRDLGPEAQAMARNCKNERLADGPTLMEASKDAVVIETVEVN